jgi:hypothetical protein
MIMMNVLIETFAFSAVLWLRENSDHFSAAVHEPMVLSLILEDEARTGPMLEKIVGAQV